jgi:hypothetical protein
MPVVDLDLTGVTDLKQIENAGRVPPGWYRVSVTDHFEDTQKEGTLVWEFTITGGAFDGKKLFFHPNLPSCYPDDPDKAKKAADRLSSLGLRFGLITDADKGKAVGVDFDRTMGMDMVVKVNERKGTEGGIFWEIGYLDVYPPNHERIPKDVRAALQLPPARDKRATVAAPTANNGHAAAPAVAGAKPAAADPFADL